MLLLLLAWVWPCFAFLDARQSEPEAKEVMPTTLPGAPKSETPAAFQSLYHVDIPSFQKHLLSAYCVLVYLCLWDGPTKGSTNNSIVHTRIPLNVYPPGISSPSVPHTPAGQ